MIVKTKPLTPLGNAFLVFNRYHLNYNKSSDTKLMTFWKAFNMIVSFHESKKTAGGTIILK